MNTKMQKKYAFKVIWSTSKHQMLGLCNFKALIRLLVECKTKSTKKQNKCSNMHMLLELKEPYKLYVSTTSQNLFKEVCAIGIQQMDLLKSNTIKRLEHLKSLQVGIWVRNVRLVASKC
jgi:hypothetical protein